MDWRTLYNAIIMCVFCRAQPEQTVTLLNAATGWDLTVQDLLPLGARAFDLKRLLNGKLGLTAQNDRLPPILMRRLPEGEAETSVPDMDVLLPAFYSARGWDPVSGMPTGEKRRELGLDWVRFPS
jgi:aldehyde:ferredoxin oxidoreductase